MQRDIPSPIVLQSRVLICICIHKRSNCNEKLLLQQMEEDNEYSATRIIQHRIEFHNKWLISHTKWFFQIDCSENTAGTDVTQEGYFVGSVAGEGRKAESPGQELQYFSPKYSSEIFRSFLIWSFIKIFIEIHPILQL